MALVDTSLMIENKRAYIVGKVSDPVTTIDFKVDVTELVNDLLNKPWQLDPSTDTEGGDCE